MSRTRIIVLETIVGITLVMAMPAWADKVAVCHLPLGNPAQMHTISIAPEALPAHLGHGDFLGVCLGAEAEADGVLKVTLCHKADITISVAPQAVAPHLSHGDTLGPCPF